MRTFGVIARREKGWNWSATFAPTCPSASSATRRGCGR